MLVLTRKFGESVVIDLRGFTRQNDDGTTTDAGLVEVRNVDKKRHQCRVAVEADRAIGVHRKEVFEIKEAEARQDVGG